MLSLAGVSGAAFVMMSCKAPPPGPLRPAMGKGLLRADTTLVLSLGQSRRPPHSARGASMLAHDGSTSTPTATATALALAMVLAFAPMGDAKAAVGVCEGMSPLRSIGCQRAVEASRQFDSSGDPVGSELRAPTQRALQAAGKPEPPLLVLPLRTTMTFGQAAGQPEPPLLVLPLKTTITFGDSDTVKQDQLDPVSFFVILWVAVFSSTNNYD